MIRHNNPRRTGFTLIEVVAATVLLSILGGVGISLIQEARQTLERPLSDPRVVDLRIFADAAIQDPASFGVTGPLGDLPVSDSSIHWTDAPERTLKPITLTHVLVRRIPCGVQEQYSWLVFHTDELEDVSICRLVLTRPRFEGAP